MKKQIVLLALLGLCMMGTVGCGLEPGKIGVEKQAITEGFFAWFYKDSDASNVYNWWSCQLSCNGTTRTNYVCATGQNAADTNCTTLAGRDGCTFIAARDTNSACSKEMVKKQPTLLPGVE